MGVPAVTIGSQYLMFGSRPTIFDLLGQCRRMREIDHKAPFPEGPLKWETLLGCKVALAASRYAYCGRALRILRLP